jgi:hypothetical protein
MELLGNASHETGIAGGFRAQGVIHVRHVQLQLPEWRELVEGMEQTKAVCPATDSHDHGLIQQE